MKKLTLMALGAIVLAGAFGCNKGPIDNPGGGGNETPDPATLSISYLGKTNNSLIISNIPADGKSYQIAVTSNRDWLIDNLDEYNSTDWLTVSPTTGHAVTGTNTVTITVAKNEVNEPRDFTLTIATVPGTYVKTRAAAESEIPDEEDAVLRKVTLKQLAAQGEGPGPEPTVVTLTAARHENYQGHWGADRGTYRVMFRYVDEHEATSEIWVELVSNLKQDMLEMDLAKGEYAFADTHEKGTFTERSCMMYDPSSETGAESAVTGGKVVVGDNTYDLDLTLANGKSFRGHYTGPIYPYIYPDVTMDWLGMSTWGEVTVNKFRGSETMWEIVMGNSFNDLQIKLLINTESGLDIPPVGVYPMAAAPRARVTGTAEPASILNHTDLGWGCWMTGDPDHTPWNIWYGSVGQYAVPGKGQVEITKESGDNYKIAFMFEGPDGKKVGGHCFAEMKAEPAEDPNAFDPGFVDGSIEYYSSRNIDIKFTWANGRSGEYFKISLYVDELDDTDKVVNDGTYTYNSDNSAFTFDNYGGYTTYNEDNQLRSTAADGGTVKFTRTPNSHDYKVEFNVHLENGKTIKGTYEGSITYW